MEQMVTLRGGGADGRDHGLARKASVLTMSGAGALACVLNAGFVDAFGPSRLFVVLVVLLVAQALTQRRLLWSRETSLYAGFVAYMTLTTVWTPDPTLAANTLFPAINFLLILLLYGSLLIQSDLHVGLLGTLMGLLAGAALYGRATGFPVVRPLDFSYNAMAAVYLCGLFCSIAYGWARRSMVMPALFAVVFWLHVVATTSIKTNLGIFLGLGVAGVIYFRHSFRMFRRSLLVIFGVGALVAYGVASDQAVMTRLEAGIDRVSLGVRVLEAREDLSGYSAFDDRKYWIQRGIEGWKHNPVFGYGVEAFRAAYGITSHSTPVELLYNTGIIGLFLFYAVFASIALRLLSAPRSWPRAPLALIMAMVTCNGFVTLSGTVFYQTFIAIFVAISAAIFRRLGHPLPQAYAASIGATEVRFSSGREGRI